MPIQNRKTEPERIILNDTSGELVDRASVFFPSEVVEIVDRWIAGESVTRVAHETGKPRDTISKIMSELKELMPEKRVRAQGEPRSKKWRISGETILAAMKRLDTSELETLVPKCIALGAARRAPHLKPTESKLLARANQTLPQELKSRLSKLQKKRDSRSLSKAESDELIALSDRVEQLHAARLEALADLARLRGKTLTELMDQLGIRFPANA